ncbi:hypothetical protein [Tropicimonas sp. IMCC34043]|uniref:hypothetical protein n=1 Tax=Tropicimonas sp. IMCC34043 TaxID=2248760 RepID=UPI000E22F0B7|nr:hypothetical protein [Tropicimonas sp. IMCC34043]
MGKTNKDWHGDHPMPKNPTEEQRLAWHLDHAAHCGCRGIPGTILALMEERGIAVPELQQPELR